MKRFLWNVLLLSSIVVLLVSCNKNLHQGYRKTDNEDLKFTPIFSHNFDKALYRGEIVFNKNKFSCLAVIKYIPEMKSYRMALLSEAGLRFFEMEFFSDKPARIQYVTNFLNKKALVKKLLADFELLFPLYDQQTINKKYTKAEEHGKYVIKVKRKGFAYYYFDPASKGPVDIRERGCMVGKTMVKLTGYDNTGPKMIYFSHHMMNFTINLQKINYSEWKKK